MTLKPTAIGRRLPDPDVPAHILDNWRRAGEHATARRFPDRDVLTYINRGSFLSAQEKRIVAREVFAEKSTPARRGIECHIERQRRLWRLKRQPRLTREEAREILVWADSYQRLPSTIRMAPKMDRSAWFTLLGEVWSGSDANGRMCGEILQILLPDGPALEMMTEPERAALAALPETVTVYRGADLGVNEQGLCWSLDRAVAARFPFLNRYLADHPVLVTATVQRDHIVAVKLDRKEAEVITKHAIVSSVEDLMRAMVGRDSIITVIATGAIVSSVGGPSRQTSRLGWT